MTPKEKAVRVLCAMHGHDPHSGASVVTEALPNSMAYTMVTSCIRCREKISIPSKDIIYDFDTGTLRVA